MNKKILFFAGGSYVSGLEIAILHLMHGLKEHGYDVRCVMNGWNDGVFGKKLEGIKIPFYEVKLGWLYLRKPLWTIDSLANYPKAFFTCRKIMKTFRPDVLHFCNYSNVLMLYPLVRGKTVYNLQETHLPTAKHRMIYKLLNRKIQAFTAVSEHIKKVLRNLSIPEKKIYLVYNGIPIEPELSAKIEPLAAATILEFAIIGQVAAWKGFSTLVDAVENMTKKADDNFIVAVYGNDRNPYADGLKKEIQEKKLDKWFKWKGFVSQQDTIYASCSVVIVPSLSEEPCSLTIIEAMSRGKGLIVSDRGGNPELITHEENGLVFKAGDAVSLALCMQTLLESRAKIVELGNKARLKSRLEYAAEKMTEKYISIYETGIRNSTSANL